MNAVKKAFNFLAPKAKKGEDGRDVFGSRFTFIFCAMGGAVGLGNVLRFPSIAYNNYGAQFLIPYFIALIFIAFPALVLEIALGTVYRSGCVLAWSHVSRRTRGVGMAVVFNGIAVVTYYAPLLAWIMNYFRLSFQSPLPWAGQDTSDFFYNRVVRFVGPNEGSFNPDGSVAEYTSWPGTSLVGETVGWTMFTFFLAWLCSFRGVGLTERVIYVTMILPLVLLVVLIGRGASLPNASDGIKLYLGTWRSEALATPRIWRDAFGQIFFSIGVGFGYFTSWASYCSQHSNAVQDALIIAVSNSAIEIFGAFAVFGVVGFLGMHPDETGDLSTFVSGFFTYPEALAQMPAANFFSVIFFFTLFLLGLTCVFSLNESLCTLIVDTEWGRRIPRWGVSTAVTLLGASISLIYCTEFGLQALDAADTYVNGIALFSVVWCESLAATSIYRYKDAVSQVGLVPYVVYHVGYVSAQAIGIGVAHATQPGIGAGVGFFIFIITIITTALLSRTPEIPAPRFWGNNKFTSRIWWCGLYSAYQLTQDFNVVLGVGKNWKIPMVWAPCLKYISNPILAIVLSFSYSSFPASMNDPLWIYGFSIMHIVWPLAVIGFIFPGWYDFIIPVNKLDKGEYPIAPMEVIDQSYDEQVLARGHSEEDGIQVEPENNNKTQREPEMEQSKMQ